MLVKVLLLALVAVLSFGFVFFVKAEDLGLYCLILAGITTCVVLMLKETVRRSELRLLLIAWAAGSMMYAVVAACLVVSGISLSPYLVLDTPLSRWLYALSYPIRMLAVLATGLLFFEFTSPLEFGTANRMSTYGALLFRAVEYTKASLVDTIEALIMIGRWPNINGGQIRLQKIWGMLRCSPALVATVVRNLLVWSPWAWMTMSRDMNAVEDQEGRTQ